MSLPSAPSLPVSVRALRADDAPALAALDAVCFPSPWTASQIADELAKPAARFLTLAAGDRPVGYGGVWLVAGEAQLANLAVHPDWRGRGLGRTLLRELMDVSRRAGARRVTLEVRENAAAARALYAAEGFVETSRRPRYYEGRETAVLMEKSL